MVYGAVPFNPYAHLSCPSGTTNSAPTFGYSPIHPMAPMGMFTNNYSNGLSNFQFNYFIKKFHQKVNIYYLLVYYIIYNLN